MKFLKKLKGEGKNVFLGGLKEQLRQQAVSELASGKLTSPASLDEMCNRIIPALRKNPLTNSVLKALKVEDTELRDLLKEVLTEVGVELK